MVAPATQLVASVHDALCARSPAPVRDLADVIAGVAARRAPELGPLAIGPTRLAFVLAGIGWRETELGTAEDCDVPGAGCTGDFALRPASAKRQTDAYRIIETAEEVAALPAFRVKSNGHEVRWHIPRDPQGLHIAPPYAMPKDGRGFGRSRWQLDYDAHPEFVTAVKDDGSPCWADDTWACDKAAGIFLAELQRLGKERLAIAAFNCGAGGVRHALDEGRDCDFYTTGSNYSRWILEHIQSWGG
jgi:hypothetical protein